MDKNKNKLIDASRTISFGLRHRPAELGITLDAEGWCDVDALLQALAAKGRPISREELDHLVASSDKQRFALSPDGLRIRANQGHSVEGVELKLTKKTPPAVLYHGTVERFLASIFKQGLTPQKRHHVHLSAEIATATTVGSRRGEAVLLKVDAAAMLKDGLAFYLSENGVWLVDAVPARYLSRFNPT